MISNKFKPGTRVYYVSKASFMTDVPKGTKIYGIVIDPNNLTYSRRDSYESINSKCVVCSWEHRHSDDIGWMPEDDVFSDEVQKTNKPMWL